MNKRSICSFIPLLLILLSSCSLQSDLKSRDEYTYDKARSLYENGDYGSALVLFQSVINEMSWSKRVDECRYYIGKCHIEQSKVTSDESHLLKAVSSFNSVDSNSSVWVRAQYETGYSYYKMEEYDSASLFLNRVYLNYPQSSSADDALLFLAHIDMINGDKDLGMEKYREIIRDYSDRNRYDNGLYHLAEAHLYIAEDTILDYIANPEHLTSALDTFELIDPGSSLWSDAQFQVGYCYYKMEEFDDALPQFRFIYDSGENSNKQDDAALHIAHIYRKTNRQDEALLWYQKILTEFSLRNSYDNALYWIGDYYYDRKLSGEPQEQEQNRLKAVEYFSRYCEIANPSGEKYQIAQGKLENLGVVQ